MNWKLVLTKKLGSKLIFTNILMRSVIKRNTNQLIFSYPLLFLPSIFPIIRVFSNESVFRIRWPKNWSFSFNISPCNEYLGLNFLSDGLVGSPCSPRDSKESTPTPEFKSINSLVLSLLYGPTLTSIHDYWKKDSFDQTNLCQQSNISTF